MVRGDDGVNEGLWKAIFSGLKVSESGSHRVRRVTHVWKGMDHNVFVLLTESPCKNIFVGLMLNLPIFRTNGVPCAD